MHRRSPTHSYPRPATLALRQPHPSTPTLLSPLASITNSPLLNPDDALNDFQSNAWANGPLAGLGITCFRNTSTWMYGQPATLGDSLRMQVGGDDRMPYLFAESHHTEMSLDDFSVPHEGLNPRRNPRILSSSAHDPVDRVELCLNSDIDPMGSDTIGLIPDVNMYDIIRRLDIPHTGVNPLDTIGDTSLRSTRISYGDPASPTSDNQRNTESLICPTCPKPEETPSPRVIQDIMSILIKPAEFSQPYSIASSSPAQLFSVSLPVTPRCPTSVKLLPTNIPDDEDYRSLSPPRHFEDPNSAHSSPVLNAHLGIELGELVARAERFKNKYPERDIDRAWLSHFAGKLSDRGELLNDFRCYVIGCDQRNKRRDHILVHIGAHIGQRPFACSLCPLRFLRKNECKRHEASHTGFRPYSCDICGQSFVRQDLVKRHVKRTHGKRDENQTRVTKQSRKKTRLQ